MCLFLSGGYKDVRVGVDRRVWFCVYEAQESQGYKL